MDPALRTLLKALVEGQVKLAEGQATLAEGQATMEVRLAEGQARLAEGQARLAGGQAQLEKSQARMMDKLTVVSEHLDDFARAVIRGFTNGASRHSGLERRVGRIERRLTRLEGKPKRPRK